jgi:hypothetical protein
MEAKAKQSDASVLENLTELEKFCGNNAIN